MHNPRARTTILLSLTGLLILSAAGCEDSASKQRDQVQAQLTQIRKDLQNAVATGGETSEAYQRNLNDIVTRLTSINNGEPGQLAAKSILAADALREVAALQMGTAADIESQHRALLGAVNARIDAVLRINALAEGLGSIDGAKRTAELQSELQKAREGVTAAQARIAELESPINERNAQNQLQKTEIERLRLQVGELLRKAQDDGYSAGFETYKRATEVNRQADKIEFEVSNREIDLEHDLNPQHKMAQTQQAQLEAMSQAIETAQTELAAFAKAAAGDVQFSRDKVAELNKTINENLAAIKATSDGELKTAYDGALAALDKAAANAKTAATGGPDANAGKMIGAAVSESIARVHILAAHGLADRLATLQRIKASNGAVAVTGVDGQIKELTDARQAEIDAAKVALDEASQTAQAITGNSGEFEAFRSNLQTLSAVVSGNPPPSLSDDSASTGGTADAGTGAAAIEVPPGAGAESPEALVATLKSITTIQDAGKIFDVALPSADPQMRALVPKLRSMFAGVSDLEAALQAKFQKGMADLGGNMGDVSLIADATLGEVTETAGTITVTNTKGESNTLKICQVSGRWFVGSPDDDAAALSALGMGGGAGDAATPEQHAMAKQMVLAMSGMFSVMGQAMTAAAADVQNGKYASFDEFKTAFAAAMQQASQGAMGAGMPNK